MNKKLKIGLPVAVIFIALAIIAIYHHIQEEKKSYLELFGNIDIRQADLGFRVTGKLDKLFHDEGDHVVPGDLLAELDHEPFEKTVAQAAARLESLKMSADNALDLLKRRQELVDSQSVSKEDFQTASYN